MADTANRGSGEVNPKSAGGRESVRENHEHQGETEYSSKETFEGREGFTGVKPVESR